MIKINNGKVRAKGLNQDIAADLAAGLVAYLMKEIEVHDGSSVIAEKNVSWILWEVATGRNSEIATDVKCAMQRAIHRVDEAIRKGESLDDEESSGFRREG